MTDNDNKPVEVAVVKDESLEQLTGNPVVAEAQKRYRRANDWESTTRYRFIEDMKFAHGDSDNGYQWPAEIRTSRDSASKPTLTINVIRQHNLNISNELRKNKQSVKFLATGGDSSQESCLAIQDLFRYVERRSDAQSVYTVARGFQIDGGIGFIRLATDYESNDSFDQEVKILPVNDPLSVFMDPDAQQKNRSDMGWCVILDSIPTDEFEAAYPDFAHLSGIGPLGGNSTTDDIWTEENHTVIAEYFRKAPKKDQLVSFVEKGERHTVRASKLSKSHKEKIIADVQTKVRDVIDDQVEWFLICGQEIIDSAIWPGRFIPIIPVIGEESVIDGTLDRKGHTRNLKDGQRMYNYNASGQVEFVALQSKTPWIAAVESTEGYETYWNTANTQNHAYLPFKAVGDNGEMIPPPQRAEPPKSSEAFQNGMQTAFLQIQMASGQYENQMGALGNERTGKAIGKRQEMSATAVYHFQDNYEVALRYLGEQFLDLFPKVYDTKRLMSVLAPDGSSYELEINPAAREGYFQQIDHMQQVSKRILNPLKIKYSVAPEVGPAYTTKSQETLDSLSLILTQAPQLIPIIGDILVKAMPFDDAMEASRRLKNMIPPEALGNGPSPQMKQLMAQNSQLSGSLAEALQKMAEIKLKFEGKSQMRDIDAYKAETERLKNLLVGLSPEQTQVITTQLVNDIAGTELTPIVDANSEDLGGGKEGANEEEEAPMQGARKAPDGEWYMDDPGRPGKYIHVGKRGQSGGK